MAAPAGAVDASAAPPPPCQPPSTCAIFSFLLIVNRYQFKLENTADGVLVTSLSAVNPTKVLPACGGHQLLEAGKPHLLSRAPFVSVH